MRAVLWGSGTFLILTLITTALMNSPTASLQWIIIRARLSSAAETFVVLMLAAAHWKLGQSHPGNATRSLSRFAYRGGASLAACAKAVWLWLVLYDAPTSRATTTAGWVEITAIVIATLGCFGYMRELARRVPDDRLARAAGMLQWNTGIGLVAYAAIGLWVQVVQPRPQAMPRAFFYLYGVAAAMCIVGGVGGAALLLRLKRWFTRAIATTGGASGG